MTIKYCVELNTYVFSYVNWCICVFPYIMIVVCKKVAIMSDLNPIQFFKCLADETRLKTLLLVFQEQELCVCELVAALSLSQPKISRHLAQLRKCGLLTDRRQGQWVFYRLSDTLPSWATAVIEKTAANNKAFMSDNVSSLDQMGDRPARTMLCCDNLGDKNDNQSRY